MAARVGSTFGLDPVLLIKAHPFEQAVRIAAHNVVVNDSKPKPKPGEVE